MENLLGRSCKKLVGIWNYVRPARAGLAGANCCGERDQFQEAKEVLEQSKTQAGKLGVEEISDEEDLPTETESSAQQITASIQTLSTSLQQLSKEAEAINIEEHTAKRPRTEGPSTADASMGDGQKPFG